MLKHLSTVITIILLLSFFSCNNNIDEGLYYSEKVAVINYHHIDEETSSATITPQSFSEHLDMLEEKGFNIICMEEFAAFMEGYGKIPQNSVVITFDDGYGSFYNYAYPELLKRNMSATQFIIVGRVGNFKGEIPKLTWEQIREMQENGIGFGSHSYDSHHLVEVNSKGDQEPALLQKAYLSNEQRLETREEFKDRVRDDLARSYNKIKDKLEHHSPYLAWPYGSAEDDTIRIAKEIGFKYIFTIKEGLNSQETPKDKLYRINAGSPEITSECLFKKIISKK